MDAPQLIRTLVGFDTISRDSNLPLIEFVENYLDDQGIRSRRVPSPDGAKSNLVASVGPERAGGVILSGHTDVVPVDGQDWGTDPFGVVQAEGRLYGRGTCDMKGFIGIALALVPQMKTLRRPLHFALSYDEEVGCLGAPAMIETITAELPAPAAVIVGEPTSMAAVTGHKGIVALRTVVRGYETHSSQTQRGVSAVMTAARLVGYLGGMAEQLAADTEPGNGFEPHHSTVHVGIIQGGTALNIISRDCEFVWDIRNIPPDDPQVLVDQFEQYCRDEVLPEMRRRHPDCSITTELLAQAPAFGMSDSPALALVQSLTGQSNTGQVSYAAEAGLFQAAGLPVVLCGPGSIDQAHQPNEYISLSQVAAGEAFLRDLIGQLSA
ncbi:MAG: acetylornithine deacetylase [Arenicellales bacterium]|jgi:acetylornithine deacetylase|nr:acetylornithine deacetylase [Arenicellales bacterium]HCV20890.1 acetylornithine deacetylase [Gammaproteobacteria bacterium]MDP6313227.1 acetylornithine deacetylase [Arenicellales bacterium]MDP7119921.1 acetylornithine deacetylase [Arenicellales bacterium]MDP7193661.1 acetylornithine deacetylase [Arenicellales bacterium]|tara:strand:- start:309 stop:1448 length:1140 start_codon:yes stop_codon:yes gene_type:complete